MTTILTPRTTAAGTVPARRLAPARACAALLLAAALAGCAKLDMNLSIDGEAVDGNVIVALDKQLAQFLEVDPDDVVGPAGDDDIASLDGVTAESFEDDEWVGVDFTFERVSIDDFNELGEGDEEAPQIHYDEQAGTYEFTMVMDFGDELGSLEDLPDVEDLEDLADEDVPDEELDLPSLDPAALVESFEVVVTVSFPGEVTEHNGQLAGTTVTWAPAADERLEMRAVALATPARSGGGPGGVKGIGDGLGVSGTDAGLGRSTSTGTALLVGLLGLVVLAAMGGVSGWLVRRGHRQPAVAHPAGEHAPHPADEHGPQ